MNTITISSCKVTEIKRFTARGETGVDVFIRDDNEYGTAYFQVEYYGNRAENILANLNPGDQVDLTGTLVVTAYKKKDGTQATIFVIKNPESMTFNGRDITSFRYKPVETDDSETDDLPF